MEIFSFVVKYNGFFLVFSAVGFLLSLIWFVFSERSRRYSRASKISTGRDFFNKFEDLENPAFTIPDVLNKDSSSPLFVDPNSLSQKPLTSSFPALESPPLESNHKTGLGHEGLGFDEIKNESFQEDSSSPRSPNDVNISGKDQVKILLDQIKKDIQNGED